MHDLPDLPKDMEDRLVKQKSPVQMRTYGEMHRDSIF